MANQINTTSDFSFQSETLTHQTRVVAAGGTISRLRDVDNNIIMQKNINQYSNMAVGLHTSHGNLVSGGLVDKIFDYSGNNRDAASATTKRPTYNTSDRFGYPSYTFDGTSDSINTPSFTFASGTAITICGWYYVTTPAALATLWNFNVQGAGTGFLWGYYNAGNFTIQYRTTAGNLNFNAGSLFLNQLNSWMHIAFIYDFGNASYRTYRNGILYTSGSLTAPVYPTGNTSMYFGSYQGGSHYYAGRMDDLRVYTSSLTQAEIQKTMYII
jgi:hypothetical protein